MQNKQHRFNRSIIMLSIMALMVVAIAMADTTTIELPATSGIVDGAGLDFNISYTNAVQTQNLVTCDIGIFSASTANSSAATSHFNVTNSTSRNALNVNFTLASADLLEDSNDYTVAATCWNTTASIAATSSTSVRVDRTVPTAATSVTPSTTQSSNNVAFSGTVDADQTTGCSIVFRGKNPTTATTMTHSGTECTLTINRIPEDQYTYFIRATDGTNSTDSADTTFTVDVASSTARRGAAVVASMGGGSVGGRQATGLSISNNAKGNGASVELPSSVKSELTKEELTKTGIGAASGAVGAVVLTAIFPPAAIITIPFGIAIGAGIGIWA